MHAPHRNAGKPDVFFKTPTYIIGGSDCSFTRQGGFILRNIMMVLFSVENINKKVGDLVTRLYSTRIAIYREILEKRGLLEASSAIEKVRIPPSLLFSTE